MFLPFSSRTAEEFIDTYKQSQTKAAAPPVRPSFAACRAALKRRTRFPLPACPRGFL